MTIEIKDKLYREIHDFCLLNNITDIDNYINNLIKTQYLIVVYGIKPNINTIKDVEIKKVNEYFLKTDKTFKEENKKQKKTPSKKIKNIKNEGFDKKNDDLIVDSKNKDVYLQIESEESDNFKQQQTFKYKIK